VAIRIDERFVVRAPAGPVWDFLVDPRRVVGCVPGGELGRIVDARTFDGTVRVKLGPLTLAYGGRVRLAMVDPAARRVTILGDAHETDGTDTALLTLESRLAPLPGGATEVVATARVDVSGRIVELGRGVLEPLAHEVFQDFASRVRASIEAEAATAATAVRRPSPAAPPPRTEPLRAIPLILRALRAWMAGWLRPRRG
jgi:carbon monoxide dehydrogenase subunit G